MLLWLIYLQFKYQFAIHVLNLNGFVLGNIKLEIIIYFTSKICLIDLRDLQVHFHILIFH